MTLVAAALAGVIVLWLGGTPLNALEAAAALVVVGEYVRKRYPAFSLPALLGLKKEKIRVFVGIFQPDRMLRQPISAAEAT